MLLIAQGPTSADTWRKTLPADVPVVLGRESAEWTAPWEQFLARQHAELTVRGGKLKVRKLATAANPLFHNGAITDAFELLPGGSFVIGRTTFTLADGTRVARFAQRRPTAARRAHRRAPRTRPARVPRRPAPARRAQQTARRHLQRHRRRGPVRPARRHAARGHPPGRRGRARRAFRRPHEGAALGPAADGRGRLRAEQAAGDRGRRGAEADRAARLGRHARRAGRHEPFTLQGRFDWAFCTPVYCEACPGWALYVAGRFAGARGCARCSRRGSRTNSATT